VDSITRKTWELGKAGKQKKKKKKRKKNDPFSIVSCSSSNRDNIYVPLLYGDSNLV
jgi:hypothetical protein